MPRGVYPRTPNQLQAAKANLAKGHSAEAREKANATLRAIASDEVWREKVSQATTAAMYRPEVREKHLTRLRAYQAANGFNFRGGNGLAPPAAVQKAAERLLPRGFIQELSIPTKGHGTAHAAPASYKADFGHPARRIVVEMDGPSHRPISRRREDAKKNEVLRALGWRVFRIKHD
jgi:hypothetical protein